jgi:hypothetical protein
MFGVLILGLLIQDPALPQWARDDPFAWERARCHPQIRGDTPLETCQLQVRQQLAVELGDALPEALRPTTELQDCARSQADSDFAVQCDMPREIRGPSTPQLTERTCSTRPRARPDGGVVWEEVCDSPTSREDQGLRINLSGRD